VEFVPLWTDIIERPNWKIIDLPGELYKFWSFCLLAAQLHDYVDGTLPDERTLADKTKTTRGEAVRMRAELVGLGLIDQEGDEFRMHDWSQWRTVKDVTATHRKRKQRLAAKEKRDTSRDGHGPVTDRSHDVTDQNLRISESQNLRGHHPPKPPKGGDETTMTEIEPPEFPELDGLYVVMPGEHEVNELKARKVWGLLWKMFKNRRLCTQFFEHQRWVSYPGWEYAIKQAVDTGANVGSVRYLEKIGMDFDINGPKKVAPIQRGEIGPVAYKPTTSTTGPRPAWSSGEAS
jgi:hypothetical protein